MKIPKIVPPLWMLPCLALMALLHFLIPIAELLSYPLNLIGFIPIAASLLITGNAAKTLAREKTAIGPFAEPSHLVTSGIYRYSRNPMYLGMSLIMLGCAFFFGSLSALIPVFVYMIILQILFILPEEKRLEQHFNDEFIDFCSRTRRWL